MICGTHLRSFAPWVTQVQVANIVFEVFGITRPVLAHRLAALVARDYPTVPLTNYFCVIKPRLKCNSKLEFCCIQSGENILPPRYSMQRALYCCATTDCVTFLKPSRSRKESVFSKRPWGKDNIAHFYSDAFILFHQNDEADFCRG